MNYADLITRRKSIREFHSTGIMHSQQAVIRGFFNNECHRLIPDLDMELLLLDKNYNAGDKMEGMIGYGGYAFHAPLYLIILSDHSPYRLYNGGYMGEDMILKLTDMGLSTCYLTVSRGDIVKEILNIDSPKQLGEFLFGEGGVLKGCSAAKKTSTGQFATDEKTLLKCADMHPIVRKVLDYRACTKLKSTYADKLPHCTDAEGRVHTTFAQAFTETGRLSSSEPNLQNIPVRSERGKPIRAACIARDPDHLLVSADYSQIELRIMAAMSGDETMLAAFRDGADIHRETAARVYDVMPALVTDEMRGKCKMVNFGIIYGISAFGLSQRLQIPRREAADLIDSYFRLYPKVRAFMDASIAKAREAGYAVTALGRRRTLRDINSRNATARQAAERDAINTPVQGTAADLIKLAMVRVHRALAAEGLRSKLVLQIHDELLFDCPRDEVPRVEALAKREMESALDLGVPLEVSVGHGANWLEAH